MTSSAEQTQMPRPDLLTFDPYSPVTPTGGPERDDMHPLALDPLGPMWPASRGKSSSGP
jgi:hypothetical protein